MRPAFTQRTAWDRSPNPLASLLDELRADDAGPIVDLTESNPTRCALWSSEPLVALLGHSRGTAYTPDPLGHPEARAAVVRYYEQRGLTANPARIALCASTSEAYGWLFKLLAERGDRILVPAPSYPLFDYLGRLEDVELVPYPLVREERWRIDLHALEAAIDDKTRAIALVHPNNPTGSFVRRDEAIAIEQLASERGIALIVDEVFGDYTFGQLPPDRLPSFAGLRNALCFVLSGLSKVLALPQLKLAWIGVHGPDALAHEAVSRLEILADTYLSVATPVQLALPELMEARVSIQSQIRDRLARNLATLDEALSQFGDQAGVRRLPVDGGWYAIIDVPRTRTEDAWIEWIVRTERVLVHPGWFFDMPAEGSLVISLLLEPAMFGDAIRRVISAIASG